MSPQSMTVGEQFQTVAYLMASALANYITLSVNDCGYGGMEEELIVNYVHPLFLKAKSAASQEYNPKWSEATAVVFADNYWKAMKVEIYTLESTGAWEIFDQDDSMNVIYWTRYFKCKRYHDGLIKKFKVLFCARGDQQFERIDFFVTYVPVVQWTTFQLMLILEVLMGLKSNQGDVTAAFIHAYIPDNEKIYVEMPRGFEKFYKNGRKKFLKMKNALYCICQSPRAFCPYLTKKLDQSGLKQSNFDPWIFVGEKFTCIVYIDDLIF